MDEQDLNRPPSTQMQEKITQLACPTCGGQLTYSAEKKKISCGHCGYSEDVTKANDMIKEQSLQSAYNQMRSFTPASVQKKVVECQSCRSQLMIDEKDVSVRCNFCGSEKVNEASFTKNLIQPQGIIPFVITKKDSVEKFRKWIKEGWFRPNALKRLAQLGDLHGIYVPFWTFDAETNSNWSGEAGFYYYETESYYENGEHKTRQVRRTRWEWRSGSFSKDFDDVLIVASKGLPRNIIEKIYPFRLNEATNYDPKVMVGWEAEIYSVEVNDGYKMAEDVMDNEIRAIARRELGGDTQRGLSVSTDKWGQTFKHLILPVWLCTYRYNNKSYQFAVNGQTGKINGEKPFSWVKITLFILFLIAIGVGIYFLVNMSSGGSDN